MCSVKRLSGSVYQGANPKYARDRLMSRASGRGEWVSLHHYLQVPIEKASSNCLVFTHAGFAFL